MDKNEASQLTLGSDLQVLLTLYQSNRSNQEFYFKQQWNSIFYSISLYIAIFSIFGFFNKAAIYSNCSEILKFPFNIMGCAVVIFSSVLVCMHECALCDTRKIDRDLRKKDGFKVIESILSKYNSAKSSFVFYFLFVFNLIGFFALLWAINHF